MYQSRSIKQQEKKIFKQSTDTSRLYLCVLNISSMDIREYFNMDFNIFTALQMCIVSYLRSTSNMGYSVLLGVINEYKSVYLEWSCFGELYLHTRETNMH